MRTRPRRSDEVAECVPEHEVRAYTKNEDAGKVSAHFARIIKHTAFYAVCKEKITKLFCDFVGNGINLYAGGGKRFVRGRGNGHFQIITGTVHFYNAGFQ